MMKRKLHSLRAFVMLMVLCLSVIYAVQTIWTGAMLSGNIAAQQQESYASALALYNSSLNEQLEQIDNLLLSSVMKEGYARDVLESRTEIDCYLGQVRMKNSFSDETRYMDSLSGIMWYASAMDVRVKFVKSGNDAQITQFLDEIDTVIEEKGEEAVDWFFYPLKDRVILVRILENQSTYTVGWIDAETLFAQARASFSDEAVLLYLGIGDEFLREGGLAAAQREEKTSVFQEEETAYRLVSPEDGYSIALSCAFPESSMGTSCGNLSRIILVTLLVLGILYFAMARYFMRPMNSLRAAMLKMQEGDFDVRIREGASFDEFALLNNSFDMMAARIKELKIEVYERQMENQKAEMQYLQSQIKPHFLTNCLNTVHNLLLMGETEKAETFIRLLSDHIRYNLTYRAKVKLAEEIHHIENYVSLQRIRYDDNLTLILRVPKELLPAEIPSMVIGTFVENAVKHALYPDEMLLIAVTAERQKDDLVLSIEDNGDGFDTDVLRRIENGEAVVRNGVEHIGITNVRKRVQLMYPGRGQVALTNTARGAMVRIRIPMEVGDDA